MYPSPGHLTAERLPSDRRAPDAPLEPAAEQQVDAPNDRQDDYHREHRDYPEEHCPYALYPIAGHRVRRNRYPRRGPPNRGVVTCVNGRIPCCASTPAG